MSGVQVPLLASSYWSIMNPTEEYQPGGLPIQAVNILRLISELEGSSQLCNWMGFSDDKETLDGIKKKYYKMYFRLKKQETSVLE
tara:strand:+ start:184 stop:438 length:255 start_codon:yes stop_codon:yes gene_type:complete